MAILGMDDSLLWHRPFYPGVPFVYEMGLIQFSKIEAVTFPEQLGVGRYLGHTKLPLRSMKYTI